MALFNIAGESLELVRDVRGVSFFSLLFYLPLRFGITTDVIVKPAPGKEEIRKFVRNIVQVVDRRYWLAPFYAVIWTMACAWLLIDLLLYPIVAVFFATYLFQV